MPALLWRVLTTHMLLFGHAANIAGPDLRSHMQVVRCRGDMVEVRRIVEAYEASRPVMGISSAGVLMDVQITSVPKIRADSPAPRIRDGDMLNDIRELGSTDGGDLGRSSLATRPVAYPGQSIKQTSPLGKKMIPRDAVFPRRVTFRGPSANQGLDLVGRSHRVLPHISGNLPVCYPEFPLKPCRSSLFFDLFTAAVCRAGEGVPEG